MLMLAHADIARYLLSKKLINTEAIVDGDLQVIEASRRNRNVKVINKTGRSYFLKQASGPGGAQTVAHEAKIYELLTSASSGSLTHHLPSYFNYDEEQGILVLQLIQDAQDFREYHVHG